MDMKMCKIPLIFRRVECGYKPLVNSHRVPKRASEQVVIANCEFGKNFRECNFLGIGKVVNRRNMPTERQHYGIQSKFLKDESQKTYGESQTAKRPTKALTPPNGYFVKQCDRLCLSAPDLSRRERSHKVNKGDLEKSVNRLGRTEKRSANLSGPVALREQHRSLGGNSL